MKKNFPINKRNELLRELFLKINSFDNVELVGNENQPKIVIHRGDDLLLVNGFVKNFIYNFTTQHFGGEITNSIDFSNNIDIDNLVEIILKHTQKIHTVAVDGKFATGDDAQLFYYKDDEEIPLFSFSKKRYFFTKESAMNCINKLDESDGIDSYLI